MRTVTVEVEEHDDLPEGCFLRFSALGAEREIHDVTLEGRTVRVTGRDAQNRDVAATAVLVDDSSAGTSLLVFGGEHGLRLRHPDGTVTAEPYLLLAPG